MQPAVFDSFDKYMMLFPLDKDSELMEKTFDSGSTLQFPSNVQCYWRLPKITLLLIDVCIFIILGLAGMYVCSHT